MLEIFQSVLSSPAGSFGFVLGILVITYFVVYKAGKIAHKFDGFGRLESSIDIIKIDIISIKAFINGLKLENNKFSVRNSPIKLSKEGKDVANSIHAESLVLKNWKALDKEIKSNISNTNNPYVIQEYCFEIGKNFSHYLNEPEIEYIKKYAFDEGHNIDNYDVVFGVLIRDKYFEENNILE